MSLLGFQQALSELVISNEFCNQVKTNSQLALQDFDLTPLEYQRLVSVAEMPGLKIGTIIHRSFRLSTIASTLPKTCQVLEFQNFREIIEQYWQAQLPQNYYYVQEAIRFSEFLFAQLKAGKLQSEFLEEVLRFELAILALTTETKEPRTCKDSTLVREPQTTFPCLNPQYRIVLFHHEPEMLLSALNEGRIPKQIPQEIYYRLLSQFPFHQLQIKPVGSRLGEVLSACNGRNCVADVCTQLSLTVRDLEVLAESGYLDVKSKEQAFPS